MNQSVMGQNLNDEDVVPTTEGFMESFYWPPLEWLGLKIVISTQRWMELSACGVAVMSRISFSWWYTLSPHQ
jgi:hypothetical protein